MGIRRDPIDGDNNKNTGDTALYEGITCKNVIWKAKSHLIKDLDKYYYKEGFQVALSGTWLTGHT